LNTLLNNGEREVHAALLTLRRFQKTWDMETAAVSYPKREEKNTAKGNAKTK